MAANYTALRRCASSGGARLGGTARRDAGRFWRNLRKARATELPGRLKMNKISKLAACASHHGDPLINMVQVALGTVLNLEGRIGRGNPVSNSASRSLNGLKILVVDDSKTIRRTAETLLSKEGCQVFTAIDGFDALSKVADHQPDLIFVDIMMPRLDGYQTCSLIKHNKVFRHTPVIMLSSKDGLFDRARGRIVGSEQYLTKPFTKDELLGAISNQIN
jgi:twitching motility two-component system response regulator PilG